MSSETCLFAPCRNPQLHDVFYLFFHFSKSFLKVGIQSGHVRNGVHADGGAGVASNLLGGYSLKLKVNWSPLKEMDATQFKRRRELLLPTKLVPQDTSASQYKKFWNSKTEVPMCMLSFRCLDSN